MKWFKFFKKDEAESNQPTYKNIEYFTEIKIYTSCKSIITGKSGPYESYEETKENLEQKLAVIKEELWKAKDEDFVLQNVGFIRKKDIAYIISNVIDKTQE